MFYNVCEHPTEVRRFVVRLPEIAENRKITIRDISLANKYITESTSVYKDTAGIESEGG